MTQPTCPKCGGNGVFRIVQWRAHTDTRCSACLGTGYDANRMKYAGIGSRETPMPWVNWIQGFAMQTAMRGIMLRSGAAKRKIDQAPDTDSADLAFERGCDLAAGPKVIRHPTEWQPALDHAAQFHPNWQACGETARGLHARNSMIMLGDWLDDPVNFVVCWTKGGGTGQALRIAQAYNIPVFNLAVAGHRESLEGWLNNGK